MSFPLRCDRQLNLQCRNGVRSDIPFSANSLNHSVQPSLSGECFCQVNHVLVAVGQTTRANSQTHIKVASNRAQPKGIAVTEQHLAKNTSVKRGWNMSWDPGVTRIHTKQLTDESLVRGFKPTNDGVHHIRHTGEEVLRAKKSGGIALRIH